MKVPSKLLINAVLQASLRYVGGKNMEIILTDLTNKSTFKFPSLPERISKNGSAEYKSYDTISLGTVKIPRGTGVKSISWNGVFFGKAKKKEKIIQKWIAPKDCKTKLEKWRDKGTVLNLLVSGTNINCHVTIDSFDGEENGAFGNFDYFISFIIKKDLKVFTINEKMKKPINRPPKGFLVIYAIKKGDTLWRIAQSKLNNSSRLAEIYELNKEQLEETAKKNGRKDSANGSYIYPGVKIKLPEK